MRQRFWQNLPLPRRLDIQRGIVLYRFVEQKIPIEVTQGRKLASHAASIDLVGEKLLQKFTNIVAARREQRPFSIVKKFRELTDVGRVSGNRKPSQTFLDAQVIEKAGKHPRIGFERHKGRIVCALSDAQRSDGADTARIGRL